LYENVASDYISLNDKLTSDSNMVIAAPLNYFLRDRECRISANTCRYCSYAPPMPYKPTLLSVSLHNSQNHCQKWMTVPRIFFKKYCAYSIYFMHYVFTQIFRYSHALLDCASMKAEILHFQTCLDRLISFEIAEPVQPISSSYLASSLVKSLSLLLWCGTS
ncbi:hypothetical protein T08_5890, partial [Trichinella sp. T8]